MREMSYNEQNQAREDAVWVRIKDKMKFLNLWIELEL